MSRLIDARGRLFGKVSVVDILVLAVIVALAVFLGLRFSGSEAVGSAETQPVTVTFVVLPAYDEMVEAYTSLGELKDISGRRIGDIVKVETDDRSQMELSGEASIPVTRRSSSSRCWPKEESPVARSASAP